MVIVAPPATGEPAVSIPAEDSNRELSWRENSSGADEPTATRQASVRGFYCADARALEDGWGSQGRLSFGLAPDAPGSIFVVATGNGFGFGSHVVWTSPIKNAFAVTR
jgi:hypothetical protein